MWLTWNLKITRFEKENHLKQTFILGFKNVIFSQEWLVFPIRILFFVHRSIFRGKLAVSFREAKSSILLMVQALGWVSIHLPVVIARNFNDQYPRLQICPRKTFSETIRYRWYLPPDLNIGESRVWP